MNADLTGAFDRLEKLMSFPTRFPIKVMGERHERFSAAIAALVRRHVPGFDPDTLTEAVSRKGTYVSLTITVEVDSREQLQSLYEALAGHQMVRIVL
ncbi:MAG: DUF493 domain-containing protein [Burkholderiaceae bacterium]